MVRPMMSAREVCGSDPPPTGRGRERCRGLDMPSPFPGMDPYLEDPAVWPGVHLGLINATEEALNAALPPNYVADIGERVYVVRPDRDVYPDVAVVERLYGSGRETQAHGGTAVLDVG